LISIVDDRSAVLWVSLASKFIANHVGPCIHDSNHVPWSAMHC
jgi:hypothetical protein